VGSLRGWRRADHSMGRPRRGDGPRRTSSRRSSAGVAPVAGRAGAGMPSTASRSLWKRPTPEAPVIEMAGETVCANCGGSGVVNRRPCPVCRGRGRITAQPRRLEVKIPPGVDTGSRIRIAGEGEPGVGGGPRGDLYLKVEVIPHPVFQREGDDLKITVDVPLLTAILGGEVEVSTLKGKVALRVPPETQNGRVFRLTSLGMPHLGGAAKRRRARQGERGNTSEPQQQREVPVRGAPANAPDRRT